MATVKFAFRKKFPQVSKETIQWYPGHMDKSFAKMQSKIKQVDCVIEVHDARIPLSGRNPNFVHRLIGPKPHILVLNKKDLIDSRSQTIALKKLKGQEENIIFTNCKDQMCRGLKQIIPRCLDLIDSSDRYNRSEQVDRRLMVIGVPNVGKSSLINALRNKILHKGKATSVGAIAGVTKAVQTDIKIHSKPPVYLVDTPGILPPRVADEITGMKLALCSCLNDDVVGITQVADFLLFWCNKYQIFSYVDYYGLPEPCDDIRFVLNFIAEQQGKYNKVRDVASNSIVQMPDVKLAALSMVTAFRTGQLGLFSLDFTDE